jgi:Bacterial membrane protein YfhO
MEEAGEDGEAEAVITWPPVIALLALLAATSLTFSNLLSAENLPTYRDLLFFTWPIKHFLHDRLLSGELPLWNPLLLMGTPFLANWQSGVFYPPSLLLLLPLPLGFNLFLFAHYVIALLGAWAWLRGRDLGAIPAAIGSGVFTLGGYLVSLLNLTNHLQAAVWAPWVLFCWERFATRARTRDFLWLVAVLSMELLGGSPETFLLTLLVVTVWTAYHCSAAWPRTVRLLSCLVLAGIATAALCAVQMLPTLEYLGQSSRAGALSFGNVVYYSLQPASALQLLLPHSSALLPADAANSLGPSFEATTPLIESYYLGVVPLCLAIAGLTAGRERVFWGFVILVGIVMALGDHTPFFPALYRALPQVVGKFRYPEKFYFLVHLAACVLAAEGARLVITRHPASVRIALTAVGTLSSVAVALCLLRWFWPADYLQLIAVLKGRYLPPSAFVSLALDTYWKARRLALVLGALAALIMLRPSILRPATASWLLLALVLVDLASANRNLNQGMSWPVLEARPLLIDPAEVRSRGERIFHGETIHVSLPGERQPALRLTWWVPMIDPRENLDVRYQLLWDTLNSDAGMLYGLANVYGSDGITRASGDLLLDAMRALPLDRAVKLLRIFATGYVLGPDPLPAPGVRDVTSGRDTPYHVFRVENPLPMVYGVSRLRVEPSASGALLAMSRDDFDPEREAIVDRLPPRWSGSEGSDTPTTITMLERGDDFWRFRAESSAPAFVVVNQSFFPGWEARVDGSPVPILRTNAIVRGVAVGAGSHQVEFAYRPKSFRVGAAISLASACFIALAAPLLAWRGRRGGDGSGSR